MKVTKIPPINIPRCHRKWAGIKEEEEERELDEGNNLDIEKLDRLIDKVCQKKYGTYNRKGEFIAYEETEMYDKKDASEQDTDQKRWLVKVEHLDDTDPDRRVGELCVRLPDELLEQLGWEIGDEVEWGETEICEDWGEHKGFTLSNLTKNPKEEDEG